MEANLPRAARIGRSGKRPRPRRIVHSGADRPGRKQEARLARAFQAGARDRDVLGGQQPSKRYSSLLGT